MKTIPKLYNDNIQQQSKVNELENLVVKINGKLTNSKSKQQIFGGSGLFYETDWELMGSVPDEQLNQNVDYGLDPYQGYEPVQQQHNITYEIRLSNFNYKYVNNIKSTIIYKQPVDTGYSHLIMGSGMSDSLLNPQTIEIVDGNENEILIKRSFFMLINPEIATFRGISAADYLSNLQAKLLLYISNPVKFK